MVRATLLTPVHRKMGGSLVHAVVVGCGRVGSAVATRLAGEGWTVAVIDQSMESFNRLDPAFRPETVAVEIASNYREESDLGGGPGEEST